MNKLVFVMLSLVVPIHAQAQQERDIQESGDGEEQPLVEETIEALVEEPSEGVEEPSEGVGEPMDESSEEPPVEEPSEGVGEPSSEEPPVEEPVALVESPIEEPPIEESTEGIDGLEVISVFSQKGGMLRRGEHSVYLRTNDEWNGFSTFYLGYRYGVNDFFQIAFEAGVGGIPHIYLAAVLTYWRLYESPNKFFFIGIRTRTGYRYQNSDFSTEGWEWLGDNYLTLQRNGIYMAFDFTIAFRFGRDRRHTLYYSIYPRIDIDFVDADNRVHVLFSPIMLGYEFRWRRYPNWSFAIEAGYTFPLPWDSIPEGQWPNFPSLGNIGFYRRW